MEPTIVLGALVVGLSLGLLGAGGSVLTVPLLVTLAGQGESEAVVGSLVVVGTIALVSAVLQARAGHVDLRAVLGLSLPGGLGSAAGAWLGGRAPEGLQTLAFGLLALGAGLAMARAALGTRAAAASGGRPSPGPLRWLVLGLALGSVTGFVGVGGGFLVVPALVSLAGLPMGRAVGSSLAVIAVNSAFGLVAYHFGPGAGVVLDREVLGVFVAFGVLGSLAAPSLGRRVPERGLRLGFAALLGLVGLGMLASGLRTLVWA